MDSLVTTPTLILHDDIFVDENFYSLDTITALWEECKSAGKMEPFIDQWGVFKGEHVADQLFLDPDNLPPVTANCIQRAQDLFPIATKVVRVTYSALYLPWDIHCDLREVENGDPYFNILIPFHDVPSRTIIFNQIADDDEFWKYKQSHQPLEDPIDQETWDKYLSFCWPEDRLYLSIKQIMPEQRAGQLTAFNRYYFHCSDSFHLWYKQPKYFLQAMFDKA